MGSRIETELAQCEKNLKSLIEMRGQAYDQIAKTMMFTVSWKDLTEKFETIQTNLLEQFQKLALQERKMVEDSILLEKREKEAEIKLNRIDEECQMKEKKLCSIEVLIQDSIAEHDLRGKELSKCCNEVSLTKEKVENCNRELSVKNEELDLVMVNLGECLKEFHLKKQQLDECSNELGFKEKGLNSIKAQIEESTMEIDSKQKQLHLVQEEIEKCNNELNSKKQELEECNAEIILKKTDLSNVQKSQEQCIAEFKTRISLCSKELDLLDLKKNQQNQVRTLIERSKKEYALLKQKLDRIRQLMEERSKELDSKKFECSSIRKLIEEYNEELQMKEQKYDELVSSVDKVSEKLGLKEKELKSIEKSLNENSKKFTVEVEKLNVVRRSLEECCDELASKEVQQGVISVICCENLAELQEQKKLYESLKRTIAEKEEELQNREKQLEEKEKMLESMKQQKHDDCSHNPASSSSANPQFSAYANITSPGLVLDDIVIDPNLTIDEISNGLQFSPDAAKLVLDVMRGSYYQFRSHGSEGFDAYLMTNIVLLLERLMKISPSVSPHVKELALQLGLKWKNNINSKTQNLVEIHAFLMFLAVYDLSPYFRREDIVILVKDIVHFKQAPEICRALCSMEEIAALTMNLVQEKRFLEAARLSKAFELSSKLVPQNILRNYLEMMQMDVLQSSNDASSCQEQLKTMEKEAETLRTFWECVVDCQLESTFPLERCMQFIARSQGLKTPLSSSSEPSLQGLMVLQSRNPQMVSASYPSFQTQKRQRFDPHQASVLPHYDYPRGYFHGSN